MLASSWGVFAVTVDGLLLLLLVAMSYLFLTEKLPVDLTAFTAASLVLLYGALAMEEAYRAIEWRAF